MAPSRVAALAALLLVAPLVLVGSAPPAASGAAAPLAAGPSAHAAVDPEPDAAQRTGIVARTILPETDNTVTRIAVRTNGDARWTVRIRTRLETESDVEEYRAFQREFRNDTASYRVPFTERIRGVVATAENATGREMSVRNVTASTSIQELPRRWGVVSFSFTWTDFARTGDEAVVVGDAFEGGFLLARNDSLVITTPSGYVIPEDGVDPEPAEREVDAVTWTGEQDFADRRPRVRMVPEDAVDGPVTDGDGDSGLGLLLGAGLLGAAVLAGAAVLLRRRGGPLRDPGDGADATGESGGDAQPDAGAGPADPPVLTDPERVERLLADAGGRMKQADVADELDWSDSKTSRVVSTLVEEDRVEKLRLGRENVLDLTDDDGEE